MYGDSVEAFEKMRDFMGFGKIYFRKNKDNVPELTIMKKKHIKVFLEKVLPYLILKRTHAEFILKNYNFGRNNNLDFDREGFYNFVRRKNAHLFRNKQRSDQIIERKKHLFRSPTNFAFFNFSFF